MIGNKSRKLKTENDCKILYPLKTLDKLLSSPDETFQVLPPSLRAMISHYTLILLLDSELD